MWKDFLGVAFDQDDAAEKVFAFARDPKSNFSPTGLKHLGCGGMLEVYYCENRLYMVRCNSCPVVSLVTARSPRHAAKQAGHRIIEYRG